MADQPENPTPASPDPRAGASASTGAPAEKPQTSPDRLQIQSDSNSEPLDSQARRPAYDPHTEQLIAEQKASGADQKLQAHIEKLKVQFGLAPPQEGIVVSAAEQQQALELRAYLDRIKADFETGGGKQQMQAFIEKLRAEQESSGANQKLQADIEKLKVQFGLAPPQEGIVVSAAEQQQARELQVYLDRIKADFETGGGKEQMQAFIEKLRAEQAASPKHEASPEQLRPVVHEALASSAPRPEGNPRPVGPTPPAQAVVAAPEAASAPAGERAGELQINWRQKGDEVAPLLEMRAYLDQFKDAGVAVGALRFERGANGKLGGSFGVSYDPNSRELRQVESTIQGLKQVGHGVEVAEPDEQRRRRWERLGAQGQQQVPAAAAQVAQAFGVGQWDALSAQLSAVPKHALTAPEQAQQKAAEQRVQQVAQQQGETKPEVVKEGKSPFDIEAAGNPASAFLKNFYAQLTGGAVVRQHLEVDYEKTRQELQDRLGQTGNAPSQPRRPAAAVEPVGGRPAVAAASLASAGPEAAPPRPERAPAPGGAAEFQVPEVPHKMLASLGVKMDELEQSGQLQKLLSGQKTDLVPMQVAGKDGQQPVKFEGKLLLHREADGTATLKMDLPQKTLVIPNGIGGQLFTSAQRERLQQEGNAGLIRGLKDEQGREFNGYVGIDRAMNKVVVVPESQVLLREVIGGVALTPAQSHALREGQAVTLSNLDLGDGGQKTNGVAQVNAATAGVEIRLAKPELHQHQAPSPVQPSSSPAHDQARRAFIEAAEPVARVLRDNGAIANAARLQEASEELTTQPRLSKTSNEYMRGVLNVVGRLPELDASPYAQQLRQAVQVLGQPGPSQRQVPPTGQAARENTPAAAAQEPKAHAPKVRQGPRL